MFDLQAISSVAPRDDLLFGLAIICGTVLLANLIVLTKLDSVRSVAAGMLPLITLVGAVSSIAVLHFRPPSIYRAVLQYILAFTLIALFAAWQSNSRVRALVHVLAGSALMLVGLTVAQWIANAPR